MEELSSSASPKTCFRHRSLILDKIQDINVPIIIASGGTDLETIVSASNLDSVRKAFNFADMNAFLVSVAAAGAAFITSLGIEWRRIGVKKDSPEMRDNSVVESTSHNRLITGIYVSFLMSYSCGRLSLTDSCLLLM